MRDPEEPTAEFATDATHLPVASERLHRDGIQAFCNGDYEEALRLFRQATLISPSNLEVLKDMGHAHLHLGQTEEARKIYHRAWSEGAPFVDLAYNFALLCLDKGDATEASRLLRAVADQDFRVKPGRFYLGLLFPSTSVFMAEVLLFLGLAARERGRPERALKHLQQAVDLNSRLMSAHQVLAECYVALRRWHEAVDKCRELLGLLPSGEGMDSVHLTLAHALFEDGRSTEAVRELQRVLERDPENSGARYLQQCFEDRLGKPLSPRPHQEVDAAEVATPLFDLRADGGLTPGLEDSELIIIGKSQAMHRVLRHARLAAASNSTVLLTGENGTGKELIARAF
jgi:tetratricopeptide (TPR) repeat protein